MDIYCEKYQQLVELNKSLLFHAFCELFSKHYNGTKKYNINYDAENYGLQKSCTQTNGPSIGTHWPSVISSPNIGGHYSGWQVYREPDHGCILNSNDWRTWDYRTQQYFQESYRNQNFGGWSNIQRRDPPQNCKPKKYKYHANFYKY